MEFLFKKTIKAGTSILTCCIPFILLFFFDYRKSMILKLVRVLGICEIKKGDDLDLEKIDPDRTYVLTVDNLMKMLAIHMKFR